MNNFKKGQSLVEYFMIIACVLMVCFYSLSMLGNNLKNTFTKINKSMVVSTNNQPPCHPCR